MYREYGRSIRGFKISGKISGKRYGRQSFIAALKGKELISPLCYQGTCNTSLFNKWLSEEFLPTIGSGYTLIMDNASFHKSSITHRLIEDAGCKLLYLPPYSPDLNPIEKVWSNLKRQIRELLPNFKTLYDAIKAAFIGYNTKPV